MKNIESYLLSEPNVPWHACFPGSCSIDSLFPLIMSQSVVALTWE